MSLIYRAGHAVLNPLARALWRPTITGLETVPREGGVVFASNHLSFIDSVVIPLFAPRSVSFLAKNDYWQGPGLKGAALRSFFEAVEAVPIDRHSPRAAQDALDAGLDVLRAGGAFGIYPEGTRSRDGRLYRGRTGVAWLALTAGVPVVPVGLIGTDRVQPVGRRGLRLEHITVAFGTPISPEPYAAMAAGRGRRELTDAIMAAIQELTGQERARGYSPLPGAD